MFIAHLPAGYLLTKAMQRKCKINKYLLVGLLASVFPDLDLLYFYLIDNRQHLHHSYWTHIPFFWLVAATLTFFLKKKNHKILAAIFFANIFLHLVLDTIVGKIEWLYPLTDKSYYLFHAPSLYSFWVYNFIFHWTFLFEITITIAAIFVFLKSTEFELFTSKSGI